MPWAVSVLRLTTSRVLCFAATNLLSGHQRFVPSSTCCLVINVLIGHQRTCNDGVDALVEQRHGRGAAKGQTNIIITQDQPAKTAG